MNSNIDHFDPEEKLIMLTLMPIDITSNLIIYPNPVNNMLSIIGLNSYSCPNIQITSSTGKLIFEKKGICFSDNYQIDLSQQAQGLYTIKIIDNNFGVTIRKFSVCH